MRKGGGGLVWRARRGGGGWWEIDKRVLGVRIRESCGTDNREQAQLQLAQRVDQIRKQRIFGDRPDRQFRDAAARYLRENEHKPSAINAAIYLRDLDPFIGGLSLRAVHSGSLRPYVDWCRAPRKAALKRGGIRIKPPMKNKTINLALGVVRRVLNLAAWTWRDENGLTWLEHPPKIEMLNTEDARAPKPLSWPDQGKLLHQLPRHLHDMALFDVNTGAREHEVCALRWEWERAVPGSDERVFVIPGKETKNADPRLIVLNSVARAIVDSWRGRHPTHVFAYERVVKRRKGLRPMARMNNSAWRKARLRAGIDCRVHDLRHTFGRRLRAAGVPLETRSALLGHRAGGITTHYSAAEIAELVRAAEMVVERREGVLLRVIAA